MSCTEILEISREAEMKYPPEESESELLDSIQCSPFPSAEFSFFLKDEEDRWLHFKTSQERDLYLSELRQIAYREGRRFLLSKIITGNLTNSLLADNHPSF
ncbi:hypothetical protein LEP1GSC047_3955 [Leptospira inadai serovar Lyme str. 10]|uniref:Uncharacterized protein n=2 Tax=Leptospira inadai serovar Lyme TaxID=293084 RepID=V6HCZ2_9LEPT|nr:hypothetical protein [Leptospira inadai]EQA37627.1 hypothetical protein LEP1GSC047_3955 [Leptospira inadai serovar Lyme str. 10]PNV75141.1 hypothetical protein BES34_009600 [Leptospira inadai serovar Lyme]